MVRFLHEETNHEDDEHEPTTTNLGPQDLKLMEEVSILDKDLANESSEDEDNLQGQVFYDASDELEDYEEPEPIIVHLRDGKEIAIPQEPTELQK